MENNQKMAILSLKKKRSRTTNTIAHKSLEKGPKALFEEILWLKFKIAFSGLFSITAQFGCLVSDGEP